MKVRKWLTINQKGSCRITKSKPGIDWDEISIHLEINLPDALFQKPRLEAKITVPDEAAASDVISSIVSDEMREAIEQTTGLTFSIAIADQDAKG